MSSPSHLSMPAPPVLPPPYSFPILASAAPVVGSIVMWAVTHSVYLLAFAFLGPAIALGSLLDAKWKGAGAMRQEKSRFAVEVATTRLAIDDAHRRERATLQQRTPSPSRVLASPQSDPERWRQNPDAALHVSIGSGSIRSSLDPGPEPASGRDRMPDAGTVVRRLWEDAVLLDNAPVVVDARDGIGVCGPSVVAMAVARGIIIQLANILSPAQTRVSFGAEFEWLADLPHPRAPSEVAGRVQFSSLSASAGSPHVTIAVAECAADLPRDCRVVLDTAAPTAIVRHPQPARLGPVTPEAVTEEQARGYAAVLRRCAQAEGLHSAVGLLPEWVHLASLPQRPGQRHLSLACSVAADHTGVRTLDLVLDGPHVVIGGTTGSGKSELLISWVLAMAGNYGPDAVNFLLVDFKGGSSFAPLARLPHCVGVITDLADLGAARALNSLRAELRFRERVLARCGVRSIEELDDHEPLARLVIVVDEFAAVVDGFPELHRVFSDIAARGRSLGVHLILCTQRPAGVVRDAVMANCPLRICLRVNNRADSVEAIGTAAAAELTRLPLGRGFIGLSGERPQLVQFAQSERGDDERAGARWPQQLVRRPWCEPLPSSIDLGRVPVYAEAGIGFGLSDVPEEQRQPCAVYDPDRHGNLLVIGAHGSGKSSVLAALQAGARLAAATGRFSSRVQWIPSSVPGAWDLLTVIRRELRGRGGAGRLLLLDDVDVLLSRFPEDYQRAFVDLLVAVLREGGSASVQLALSMQRSTSALQAVAALCDARMLLRLPDRQEHVMAGGTAADFMPDAPSGAALWRGHRVQVAMVPVPSRLGQLEPPPRLELSEVSGVIAVSSRPRVFARALHAHPQIARVIELAGTVGTDIEVVDGSSGRAVAFVADPETWQSRWSVLEQLRSGAPMVFDGCAVTEFRAITRLRALPPPLEPGSDTLWLKDAVGTVRRVRL
ncbi:MAG: FtsK/SpoIIIE domain-containing protein [Terrimesophilobacter sp.]